MNNEFFQALADSISQQIADQKRGEDYNPQRIPDTPEKWLRLRQLRDRGMQNYLSPARSRDYPVNIQKLAKAIGGDNGIEDALWIAMNMKSREVNCNNPKSPDSTTEQVRLSIPKIFDPNHWLTVALGEHKIRNMMRSELCGKRLELNTNFMLSIRNEYRDKIIRVAMMEGKSAKEITEMIRLGEKQTENVISKINSEDEIDFKLEIILVNKIIESIKTNDPKSGEFKPETIAVIKNNSEVAMKYFGDIYESTKEYSTNKNTKGTRGN